MIFMMTMFDVKVASFQEAGIEALKLAKGLLNGEIERTPYSVAKFSLLAGYPDVEVFAHASDDDPFNNEEEYEEENIYYYLNETGDVIRVTFEELERLSKAIIKFEVDICVNISDSEKEEYEALIKD